MNTNGKYLAIDSDVNFAESESMVWRQELGIDMVRVDNMNEGIKKLHSDNFLYVGINSDVVDFAPLLETMSSIVAPPIFIATSDKNYSLAKREFALKNGADMYAHFQKSANENIRAVMAQMDYLKLVKQKSHTPETIYCCKDLILTRTRVFIGNTELNIAPGDLCVLRLLMQGNGSVITYGQILNALWNGVGGIDTYNLVQGAISRIRSRIATVSDKEYIQNVRNEGYKIML